MPNTTAAYRDECTSVMVAPNGAPTVQFIIEERFDVFLESIGW